MAKSDSLLCIHFAELFLLETKLKISLLVLLVSNFFPPFFCYFLISFQFIFPTLSTDSFIWVLCTFFLSSLLLAVDERLFLIARKKLTIEDETFCLRFKRAQHIKWGEIAASSPTHVAAPPSTTVKYWLRWSTFFGQFKILRNVRLSDYSPLLLFSQLKTWLLLDLKLGRRRSGITAITTRYD